jgi:inner membrane protein
MDSLTQIVLGASVGEAVCGRKIGNHALLWGAIAGTIPDLDVLASPFQDLVQQLTFHRSLTHSLLFAIVAAPAFAWVLHYWYHKYDATFKDWFWLFFLGFTTHALLDCFTTWGTKVFYPFSDYAVSFHSIFVIDPLYTLPFLICVIIVSFYNRQDVRRTYWNYTGLVLSSMYLCMTLFNKHMVNTVFEKNFKRQGINYIRYSTRPTPFNTILWSITAETTLGYLVGYYSLLDKDEEVKFTWFPKQHELLDKYSDNKKIQKLLKITDGYYTVTMDKDSITVNDLRFGQLDGFEKGREDFVFAYQIVERGNDMHFTQKTNNLKKAKRLLPSLWTRVVGKK